MGVWFRTCSLTYLACNQHLPYCVRPLWLHQIFRHYFDFRRQLLSMKCVFWFYLQLLFETFLVRRRIQLDIVINMKTYLHKVPIFCRILMKLWFFKQIFGRSSNIKIHQNPSSGTQVLSCGQTDYSKTGMTKLIAAFRKFSEAPKNGKIMGKMCEKK
jgi:hypothetical protein